MEEHGSARSDRSETSTGNNLSQEVAARADQKRRTSSQGDFWSFLGAIIGALSALAALISLIPKSLFSSAYIILAISIIGAVAIIVTILVIWVYLRRSRHRPIYTNEKEISDDNLRKLISGIARSQIEFQRRINSASRSSLPKS